MAKAYAHLFNLMLIGDSGSGKSKVLFRYSQDAFNSAYVLTMGLLFFYFCFVVCLISANSTVLIPPGIRLKIWKIPPAGTVSKWL